MRSMVVFPQPEGPRRVMNSPSRKAAAPHSASRASRNRNSPPDNTLLPYSVFVNDTYTCKKPIAHETNNHSPDVIAGFGIGPGKKDLPDGEGNPHYQCKEPVPQRNLLGFCHAGFPGGADHVTAWSKGGATDISNCQMLCKTHNRAKGNR